MKWDSRKRKFEIFVKNKSKPHVHFALRPVTLEDGRRVWLEKVLRQVDSYSHGYKTVKFKYTALEDAVAEKMLDSK